MASNYLEIARLESGRIYFRAAEFDLIGLLDECISFIEPAAREQQIEVVREFESTSSIIEADREKIKPVITNLLSNAVKYNHPQGNVTLSMQKPDPDTVTISITDTGIGMSGEDLSHLFERFFRSSQAMLTAEGTGLGLSICKQIIEAHGGSISAVSKPETGSTFTVCLPVELG
jgi:signal transduction histidine kinase